MIPITDRHLQEACGLALEQDIAEFTSQPCSHCFSEDFHESIQQMQEGINHKRTAKFSGPQSRPLWKFLPVAAVIALACLAGYRLLEFAPFRMDSAKRSYSQKAEDTAKGNSGTGAEDTGIPSGGTETTGEEAAEETAPYTEEVPGGAMTEEYVGDEAGYPDLPDGKNIIEEGIDPGDTEEALPELAENQDDTASDNSATQKQSGKENDPRDTETQTKSLKLLSAVYDASTQLLKLELQNISSKTIILENKWMLYNSDGDTINIELDDPVLSNPSSLRPNKIAAIRCILLDGELPEGEYILDLGDGETTLTFTFP